MFFNTNLGTYLEHKDFGCKLEILEQALSSQFWIKIKQLFMVYLDIKPRNAV